MAIQERDPRPYELMTVFIPELSEEDTQAQIERTEGYISSAGGAITETLTSSPWGRRRLAYTIRFNGVDYRDGFYTVFHFDARPSILTEMERDLKLDTNVMRYLLVHDDPKAAEKPSEDDAEATDATETEAAEAASTEAPAETATEDAPVAESATEVAPAAEAATEDASVAEAEAVSADEAPVEAGAENAVESAEEADEAPADDAAAGADDETAEASDNDSTDKE